uniref:Coiled-coil domain-containing protein 18-like n=1 Tax=Phallusia mammillata TaxID=59560 RepID=A0A6F9D8Q6_9ASCI|nr:coiled-coil domain-containing protein 18-like [Phallusia mammillata]
MDGSPYQDSNLEQQSCMESSDRSHSKTSVKHSPCRPISARSNATSVTLLETDVEIQHPRNSMSIIQADNERLKSLIVELQQQLLFMKHKMKLQEYSNGVSDKFQCLNDELEASQRKIRMNEEDLEKSEINCHEKDKEILALKTCLFQMEQRQLTNLDLLTSLKTEKKRLLHKLQTQSEEWKEKETCIVKTYITNQQEMQNKLNAALKDKANYHQILNSERKQNLKLVADVREQETKTRGLENEKVIQQKEVTRMLDEAQKKIKSFVEEVSTLRKQNVKLTDDITTLQTNCSKFEAQVSQLEDHVKDKANQYDKSYEENASLKEINKQLKKENLVILEKMEKLQDGLSEKKMLWCNASTLTEENMTFGQEAEFKRCLELETKLESKDLYVKHLEVELEVQMKEVKKWEQMQYELQKIKTTTENNDERSKLHENILHSLDDERNILQHKVKDLEELLRKQMNECESLEQRLQERTNTISEKQITFHNLMEEHASLKCKHGETNKQYVSIKNDLSKKIEENKSLNKKVKYLEESLLEKERMNDEQIKSVSKQELIYKQNLKKINCCHSEEIKDLTSQIHEVQMKRGHDKQQAANLSEEVFRLNSLLQDSILKEQCLDNKATSLEMEIKKRNKEHEDLLIFLQHKVKSSSLEVKSLESALTQCKSDIESYVDQLHLSQTNFQDELSIKHAEVEEMKQTLLLYESSNNKMSIQQAEMEKAMLEKEKMLEAAAAKCLIFENCQKNLQSKVSSLEQQLLQTDARNKCLLQEMDDKLQIACHQLDQKHKEFIALNETLRNVDKEFLECKHNLAHNEIQLEKLMQEKCEALQSLEKSEFEWNEIKAKLDDKIEHVVRMEDLVKQLEQDLKIADKKHLNLETQLADSLSISLKVDSQNKELVKSSDSFEKEVKQKQILIESLRKTVSTCQNDLQYKTEELKRLEKTLEERQSQLDQRADQLSEIQKRVDEFQKYSEKCNLVLNNQLQTTRTELNERNKLVDEFDKRVSCMGDEVVELRHQLIAERQNVSSLNQDLHRSKEHLQNVVKELNEVTDANETYRKQCLELSQEIGASQERERTISQSYQECRGNVERCNKQIEKLLVHVNEQTEHCKAKDRRIDQLTEQLSAAEASKSTEAEAFRQQLETSKKELQQIRASCIDEVNKLKTSNTKLTQQLSLLTGNGKDNLESQQKDQLLRQRVVDLERELLCQKQTIEAANDAIILKDSESARCHARVSGFNRLAALEATSFTIANDGKPGVCITSQANQSVDKWNDAESNSYQPPLKNNSTTMSLFADVDAEICSLAASFVPVTGANAHMNSETDSFFVTSSPTVSYHSINVPGREETSLHQRVFADRLDSHSTLDLDIFENRTNKHYLQGTGQCVLDLKRKMEESENRRRCISSKLKLLDPDPS